jgi:integrase
VSGAAKRKRNLRRAPRPACDPEEPLRTRSGVAAERDDAAHLRGLPVERPHLDGRQVEGWRFNKEWIDARKTTGLDGKLFHDLRRTAARNLVRGGVPEEIAMKVTGHRTRAMFGRYNIASLEDKLEALQKASVYAAARARVGSNVVSIETRKSSNGTSTL